MEIRLIKVNDNGTIPEGDSIITFNCNTLQFIILHYFFRNIYNPNNIHDPKYLRDIYINEVSRSLHIYYFYPKKGYLVFDHLNLVSIKSFENVIKALKWCEWRS